MKKFIAVFCALAFVAGCGGSSGKVLVKINGDKITEGDLSFLAEINPRLKAQIDNPAGQRKILDNLVEQDLFYQEALKQGINRDPKVKAKIDLYRRIIVAQSLLDAETEKAAKKYYDDNQGEFQKLKISDIMIKFATPEEIKKAKKGDKLRSEQEALKLADEVKARLDKGEDFAKVASEVSDDTSTKMRGGDLGLVSKADKRLEARGMAPVLEKAFELKVGESSGPIKTDKGYHIVTVTRGLELEPFAEAKEGILFKMRNQTKDELLARLKKESKIVYTEDEKKKAETKAAAPAAPQEEVKPPQSEPSPQPPAQNQDTMKAISDAIKAAQQKGAPPKPAETQKKK